VLFQMLLRSSNAVGYSNYPDNVVKRFVHQSAAAGVDLFRVFDSLNSLENMQVAIDAVLETGALLEGAICYSGDLFDASRPKFALQHYLRMAKELEHAGCHIIAIKDMAGICRPRAATALFTALRNEVGLPLHFHTHDTSGLGGASILAAIDAGCHAVDGALDAMSGLTSQPNLGSIVAALEGTEKASSLDREALNQASHYWEGARRYYLPFESDIRAGTSDVYRHEMPGGQYTNLREQARSMGLDHRWSEVARAYAEVNRLFGDIVKVTPTSKVVGDMALYMVANDLTAADVEDPAREIAFPDSVISLFRGDIGVPPGGFPPALQRKILKGMPPLSGRPGAQLAPVDFDAARADIEKSVERSVSDHELMSALLYPKVFQEYAEHRRRYGDVSRLPTPVFFNGLRIGEETSVHIDQGKTLVIRLLSIGDQEAEGTVRLSFELNGQPRDVKVPRAGAIVAAARPKAEAGNPLQVGAPMPGTVVTVSVKAGQQVKVGDPLVSIEAMKMETMLRAELDGVIAEVEVKPGTSVQAKELLVTFQAAG
jgi:pyruvate carboxylase